MRARARAGDITVLGSAVPPSIGTGGNDGGAHGGHQGGLLGPSLCLGGSVLSFMLSKGRCSLNFLFRNSNQMKKRPTSAVGYKRPISQYARVAMAMGSHPRYRVRERTLLVCAGGQGGVGSVGRMDEMNEGVRGGMGFMGWMDGVDGMGG